MQIPQATVRSLALRPIGLEDEEEEEEDASGELQLEAEAANQQRLQQQQQEQLARQQTSGDGRSLEASFWDKGTSGTAQRCIRIEGSGTVVAVHLPFQEAAQPRRRHQWQAETSAIQLCCHLPGECGGGRELDSYV